MRHGHSESNIEPEWLSCWPEKKPPQLTPKGIKQIEKNAKVLKKIGIDLIVSSDILRVIQSAEIISKTTKAPIVFDKRLRELNFGIFNGRPLSDHHNFYKNKKEQFKKRNPKGENLKELQKRMVDCFGEINKMCKGLNIVIASHGDPLWLLEAGIQKKNINETLIAWKTKIKTGELRELTV